MLTPMASNTNTGGASSSSSKNTAQHLYQRPKETDQILALEEYELGSAGSEGIPRAHETVVSKPNEGPTSSNTEQEKKDSNEISLEEELHQELWKSFSNFLLIENRVHNPSRFKKKILSKEREQEQEQNQRQTEFLHIQKRLSEAWDKLSELSSANQRAESTINLKARGKASSEEELEEESEPQPTAESSTDLKGKGRASSEEELEEESELQPRAESSTDPERKEKVPSEEALKIVEQKINSQKELEKKLQKELEELEQQLIGLKNANGNILKFLTVIDADLKGKALYDFSWLRLEWVTGLTPPIVNIPSIIANIILRSPFVGWCIALGTNLITWGINDVFNTIIDKLNQYQTDDLKFLKEEVFPAMLLCIVDQRISDFEQEVSNFKKMVSNLEKRIEEMSSQIIIKTQRELVQAQRDLVQTQRDLVQAQQELVQAHQTLAEKEEKLEQTFSKNQTELLERDTKHEAELLARDLKHETELLARDTKHETELLARDTKHETDITELKVQMNKRMDEVLVAINNRG